MNKRLMIVFLLGFSSGLPLSLITGTLQAWFADAGMSTMATGLLSLLGLPYIYRIFWGPLLDRYTLFSLGRRRSWMLSMQVVLLLGFNLMAWFNPVHTPELLAALAFCLACFSATQDAAIDAQRVEYLPASAHALGASLASLGYRLAMLVSGGLALVIASRYGWSLTYHVMGSMMLIGILATLVSREPIADLRIQESTVLNSFIAPLKELTARPGLLYLLGFIIFYKLGEAFTTTSSGIVMPFLIQGLGFPLDTIGYINKILGIGSIILGGLLAGVLLIRWSLYRALMAFGLLQAVTNLLFVALAMVGKHVTLLAIAVACDNFAAGMGSTALVALFMRLVNQKFTATQFSLLVAVSALPRVFSGPIAASIQWYLGWVGLYQLSFLLALGFIPFLMKIKPQTLEQNITSEMPIPAQ
ncbi:AmpG family muropeptide MFS transporter [Legionella sp. CNM-4043-24]|uniref:AmpG family muropeptide MFS transporter n=1 Tax=Legionella sp. CNM-4043-24 TaxID=3421646 RepID=UPI00403AB456